jgi:RNA polymerase sigma-70 factor (ECF subfamily)
MDQQEWLAQQFEDHRRISVRLPTGCSAHSAKLTMPSRRPGCGSAVPTLARSENLGGWLTTVVARVALNMLRSRSTRREQPLDVRVPEPIIDSTHGSNPEHEALLADSVGLALLVVLETLTPAERLAFVLHDTFAVPFEEIAVIMDRSPRPPASSPAVHGAGYAVQPGSRC